MEENNTRTEFWKLAALGGLLLGLTLFLLSLMTWFFEWTLDYSGTLSIVQILLIATAIYLMGKRVADYRGDLGFSFRQSVGFVLAMMLFTGIIYGVGEFLLQTYIDPEYYQAVFEDSIRRTGMDKDKVQTVLAMREQFNSPFIMVISGILSMELLGGLVGLVVSVFLKEPPVENS